MGAVVSRRTFSDKTQRQTTQHNEAQPNETPRPRAGRPRAQGLAVRARNALASFAPSRRTGRRPVPPPEIRAAYRVLNFALRAGAAMLSSGASTIEVEATILELAAACGLERCETDVTFTSMTASYIRSDDSEPITAVWVVRHRTVDYGRLAAVNALRADLKAGRIAPEEGMSRLDEVLTARPRRSRVVLASWAGMAAAFTVLLGGQWIAAATAFVSATVVTLLMRAVARYGIPEFFQAVLGAAVATGIAMAVVAAHVPVQPAMVVAGGIMVLVPGYALVASVRDAITGFPISGSARGLEVLLTAAGICTGVAATLSVAVSFGVVPRLGVVNTAPITRAAVQVAAAGVATSLYATAALVPRRSIGYAGLVGAGGWAVFLVLGHHRVSLIVATAVAAILIGMAGTLLARRQRTHAFLYLVPGVMPLVPGLTIYQGMLDLYSGSGASGGVTLLRAVALGLTIAAGVTLGEMIIRPVRKRPDSTEPVPDGTTPEPADEADRNGRNGRNDRNGQADRAGPGAGPDGQADGAGAGAAGVD